MDDVETWTETGRFGDGPEYTVGVEEELMVLDPETLALVPAADRLVRRCADPLRIKPEIRRCMLELATDPATTCSALLEDLTRLRRRVTRCAHDEGLLVAGAGTHPFSEPAEQPATPTPRYESILGEIGYPWRRALVFGTHVHVAVRSADKAVAVAESLLAHLPVLVALGATSPFWRGRDTGLASTRLVELAAVPRTGIPPYFRDFAAYSAALDQLRRCGLLVDASQLWWDVRCQPAFGTVEVRVLDAQPCPQDTAALAGLVQALVRRHGRRWEMGHRGAADRLVVAENRWQAVRHGLDARLVGRDGSSHDAYVVARDLLDRLVADEDLADDDVVTGRMELLVRDGGRCARLREAFRGSGGARGVARLLVDLDEGSVGAGLAR